MIIKKYLKVILLIAMVSLFVPLLMVAVIPENTSIETFVLLIFAGSIILIILMGPIYLFKYAIRLFKSDKSYNITLKQLIWWWALILIFYPIIVKKNLSDPEWQTEGNPTAGIIAFVIIGFGMLIILILYTIGWRKRNKNKINRLLRPLNQEILNQVQNDKLDSCFRRNDKTKNQ